MYSEPDYIEGRQSSYPKGGKTLYAFLISIILNLIILIIAVSCSSTARHWAMAPITLCGIVIGVDVVRWFLGDLEPFDPKAVIALIAYNGYFVAPLLHLAYNVYTPTLYFTSDFRDWFGYMAILDTAGMLTYHCMQAIAFRKTKRCKGYWQINLVKSKVWFPVAVAISVSAFAGFMIIMGGYSGLIAATQLGSQTAYKLVGKGWMLMLGEPMPILLFAMICVFMIIERKEKMTFSFYILMMFFAVLQFIIAGGRGSRSAVIWAVIAIAGMVHYWARAFRTRTVIFGLVGVFIFVYIYGYYSDYGEYALEALTNKSVRESLMASRERTKLGTLTTDLARADIQAFILNSVISRASEYDLRKGKTYLLGAAIVIPRNIWRERPFGKQSAFDEMMHGKGLLKGGRDLGTASARVYGLPGEAMLNFGVYGVLPAFAVFGMIVGYYRKKLYTFLEHDARFLLAPILTLLCFMGVFSDFDNIVFATLHHIPLLFLALFLSTDRIRIDQMEQAC